MLEEIEKINKKIDLLRECRHFLAEKHKEAYKIDNLYPIVPDSHKVEKKIKDLEYLRTIYTKLKLKNIDITKNYFITDNIYLSVFLYGGYFTFYFYVEDDSWLYNEYFGSHSGINEWITKLISDEYDLFTGNSSYTYASGTETLNDILRIVENKKRNDWEDRPYTVNRVVKTIENLINFFTDEKNKTRNCIIDNINYKLNSMKKLIEESE